MNRELLQQALEALMFKVSPMKVLKVIAKLEAELAKPEQKLECETCAAKRKRLTDAGFLKSPLRQESDKPEQTEDRCASCDGTGDVHDLTGEWRGKCYCGNKPEQEPVAKYSDIVSDGGFDPRNKYDTAQVEQQYVAWVKDTGNGFKILRYDTTAVDKLNDGDRLYTSPPRKEWVGLTDEQIWLKTRDIDRKEKGWAIKFAHAIEVELKEKNT